MANRLEVSEAQMLGFAHHRDNPDNLLGLISAMGLTKKEWQKIKGKFSLFYFTESDINQIDDHFKTNK